jgi:hypothetical protein
LLVSSCASLSSSRPPSLSVMLPALTVALLVLRRTLSPAALRWMLGHSVATFWATEARRGASHGLSPTSLCALLRQNRDRLKLSAMAASV